MILIVGRGKRNDTWSSKQNKLRKKRKWERSSLPKETKSLNKLSLSPKSDMQKERKKRRDKSSWKRKWNSSRSWTKRPKEFNRIRIPKVKKSLRNTTVWKRHRSNKMNPSNQKMSNKKNKTMFNEGLYCFCILYFLIIFYINNNYYKSFQRLKCWIKKIHKKTYILRFKLDCIVWFRTKNLYKFLIPIYKESI